MTRRYLLGTVAGLLVFLLAFVNVSASLALIVALALPSSSPNLANASEKRRPPTCETALDREPEGPGIS